jgi:hypothetical protein
MGKTFGSGDSTTQKKASSSTDSTKLPLAGGTLTGDLAVTGTTPTITVGDAGAEDTKIVFDGNAQDYYVGLDDTDDTLVIGKGSTVGTTPAIQVDSNTRVILPSAKLVIGDATAEDTTIVFDGNEIDYYMGIDDAGEEPNKLCIGVGSTAGSGVCAAFSTDALQLHDGSTSDFTLTFDGQNHDWSIGYDHSEEQLIFGLDGSAKAVMHSDVAVTLSSGSATQTPGFGYLPNFITWSTEHDLTLTASQSGSTIVMTSSSGDVILPEGGTNHYGMQFVIINATTAANSTAVQRQGSTDTFFDSDTTSGEASAQSIAAMKAKTFIYFAENKWLVIG